jgi:hypothetical protein
MSKLPMSKLPMSKLPMSKLISLLLLSCLASGPAPAATRHAQTQHVVEVVDASSIAVRFIINGHAFTPVGGACSGWTAGDGVSLISGEWHGYCANAVLHNTTRGRTCETRCNSW